MYRVYELTEKENNKITRMRWDGDTHYYDVFESQEECDEEQKRLDKIEEEYRKAQADYLQSLKKIIKSKRKEKFILC
jgi:tetrahydromethanopterin S-methyltransferase subunit G